MRRAVWLAVVVGLLGCNSSARRERVCQDYVDLAKKRLDKLATEVETGEGDTPFDKASKEADDIVAAPTKQCTAPATASPNATYQLSTITEHRAKVDAAVAAETARRKKDPNIAKRGPKPKNSAWDGSLSVVERWVKGRLKDPDSYEHVSTTIPVEDGAFWRVGTSYRAKNSFGAKVLEGHTFWIQNGEIVKDK